MIKQLRTERNLTQQQFADVIDVPIRNIRAWEQGQRTPPEWVLNLIIYKLDSMTKGKQIEITDKIYNAISIKRERNKNEHLLMFEENDEMFISNKDFFIKESKNPYGKDTPIVRIFKVKEIEP